MISGLKVNDKLQLNPIPYKVSYSLDPYDISEGPIRSMQKFTVIMMTTVGTDAMRPWFGTKIPIMCRMNVSDKDKLRVLVRDELSSAINQFFKLQQDEGTQNRISDYDIIESIEIKNITVNEYNQVSAELLFTPKLYSAIVFSIEIPRE